MTRFFGVLLHFVSSLSTVYHLKMTRLFILSTVCHLKLSRFFGALLLFGFTCPRFVNWKWLDFLVRCCTSFPACPQFVILKWLDFSACPQFLIWKWLDFLCLAELRFRLSTVCYLKMTKFFGALLHFVSSLSTVCYLKMTRFFNLSTVCHLKMTRFFCALLHFGFACPQFVIWKWLATVNTCNLFKLN